MTKVTKPLAGVKHIQYVKTYKVTPLLKLGLAVINNENISKAIIGGVLTPKSKGGFLGEKYRYQF